MLQKKTISPTAAERRYSLITKHLLLLRRITECNKLHQNVTTDIIFDNLYHGAAAAIYQSGCPFCSLFLSFCSFFGSKVSRRPTSKGALSAYKHTHPRNEREHLDTESGGAQLIMHGAPCVRCRHSLTCRPQFSRAVLSELQARETQIEVQ
jgi:hypothetical protein